MASCVVCGETVLGRNKVMCENCLRAKYIIQQSAGMLMRLHCVPEASGPCVDCGQRASEHRDHRYYSRPLEVAYVCSACNHKRGHANDLFDLIKRHRGLIPEVKPVEVRCDQEPGIPDDLTEHMSDYERRIINRALQAMHFNVTATARMLGISFRALRYRIEKLGIQCKVS